jgi:DNA polymerase elongation subunit (family B)
LNTIAESLGLGSKLTEDIEGMTVHNGWYDYWSDFVDYCLLDTTLLRDIDKKLNAIDFFLATQQLCGVSFGSTHKVTRYFRGLIGRRTDKKAKSAINVQREALTAAHIPDPIPGRHEGVAIVDYASLYPNIILSDNLCYLTKRDHPTTTTKTLENGSHWCQKEKGLLPAIVEEMLALRAEYKKLMREATDPDVQLGYDMMQTAAKVLVNALYGMTGMKFLQGMWIDNDIAAAITHRGRECIHHLLSESEAQGYKSLYGHTDSAFIQVPFDKATLLAEHLTKTAQEKLQLKTMEVELEAYFDYWTTAPIKNRYFGIKVWPEKSKGEMKIAGYEIKASSSSRLTKQIQDKAMQLIATGADETTVTDVLREVSLAVKNGEIPIDDVVSSSRIRRPLNKYDKPTPGIRAAMYYNEHVAKNKDEKWREDDSVTWTYVNGFVGDTPDYYTLNGEREKAKYIAFRDKAELENYSIDWEKVLSVMVKSKLLRIYESLDWGLGVAAGDTIPKSYF